MNHLETVLLILIYNSIRYSSNLMDLFKINLQCRNVNPQTIVDSDNTNFASNGILSSSAWSSVIHQPSQDSDLEDLPSTVDIDAIKELDPSAKPSLHISTACDNDDDFVSGTDSNSDSDEKEIEDNDTDSSSINDFYSVSSLDSLRKIRNVPYRSNKYPSCSPSSSINNGSAESSFSDSSCDLKISPKRRKYSLNVRSRDLLDLPIMKPLDVNSAYYKKPCVKPDESDIPLSHKPSNHSDDSDDVKKALMENNMFNKGAISTRLSNTQAINNSLNQDVDISQSRQPELTKAVFISPYDSSSEYDDMLPKQIVCEAIDSIQIDSESSKDSFKSHLAKVDVINDMKSDDASRQNALYSSTLMESFSNKSKQLNKSKENLSDPVESETRVKYDSGKHIRRVLRSSVVPKTPGSVTKMLESSRDSNENNFQNHSNSIESSKHLSMNQKSSPTHTRNKCLHTENSNQFDNSLKVPPFFVPAVAVESKSMHAKMNVSSFVNDMDKKERGHVKKSPRNYKTGLLLPKSTCSSMSPETNKLQSKPILRESLNHNLLYSKTTKPSKHNKCKKNDKVGTSMDSDFFNDIENLVDILNKKCVIRSKKAVSNTCSLYKQKLSVRSNKRKVDSDTDTNSGIYLTKVKRKRKKSFSEELNKLNMNIERSLPLKKRYYHGSTNQRALTDVNKEVGTGNSTTIEHKLAKSQVTGIKISSSRSLMMPIFATRHDQPVSQKSSGNARRTQLCRNLAEIIPKSAKVQNTRNSKNEKVKQKKKYGTTSSYGRCKQQLVSCISGSLMSHIKEDENEIALNLGRELGTLKVSNKSRKVFNKNLDCKRVLRSMKPGRNKTNICSVFSRGKSNICPKKIKNASIESKLKRRRRNKTGFPVIKRKKKRLQLVDGNEKLDLPHIPESYTACNLEDIEEGQESGTSSAVSVAPQKTNKVKKLKKKIKKRQKHPRIIAKDVRTAPIGMILRKHTVSNTSSAEYGKSVLEAINRDGSSDDSKKDATSRVKHKKKNVIAGLFSDYFKDNCDIVQETRSRILPHKSEEDSHGIMPPPLYFEDWVRRRKVDFKLPYDLWRLRIHNKLWTRDAVESWNYKKIRTNVYYDVKPSKEYEAQACLCSPPTAENDVGCGDNCVNRAVFAECSPYLCPLNEVCSNQRIQKHNSANLKLTRFKTLDKGYGMKTEKLITAGSFILEYTGEVVTDKEFKDRMTSLYKHDVHHYCLNLDGGLVIDSHRMGCDARFVNHSCEPNCEIQKWNVKGRFIMALFAQRDIQPGEELTYDYNFSLFNPSESQLCYCGSTKCRGVIGGKTQRILDPENIDGTMTRVKSRQRPRKQNQMHNPLRNNYDIIRCGRSNLHRKSSLARLTAVPALNEEDRTFIVETRVFLARNLTKVRKFREKLSLFLSNRENPKKTIVKQSVRFSQLLDSFSSSKKVKMKTRGISHAEDNPEITKTLKLASLLRSIFNDVTSVYDHKHKRPFSELLKVLPRKDREPSYYQKITDPIDLITIEANILNGAYKDITSFDNDMTRMYTNSLKFYGRFSEHGIAAIRIKRSYNSAKRQYVAQIEEVIDKAVPPGFRPIDEDKELKVDGVIRCICGLYNDEGTMILCERCFVWQHCSCIRANRECENYHCEKCVPRDVDYEISLDMLPPKYPNPDDKHYLTLMRDDLQIRLNDTVYVLRDIPNPKTGCRHNFQTMKDFKIEDCDIFQIEQLWKTESGDRFAFGHHYLRPHETFHEPTRKFYLNELLMVLLYETVPFDLIMGRCHVMDPSTYSKGRPIDSDPNHIYVCEWRVDKAARTFYKLTGKNRVLHVGTKSSSFISYDTPLKLKRDYAPHGESTMKSRSTNSKRDLVEMKSQESTKSCVKAGYKKVPEVAVMSHLKNDITFVNHNISSAANVGDFFCILTEFKDRKFALEGYLCPFFELSNNQELSNPNIFHYQSSLKYKSKLMFIVNVYYI